MSMTSAFSFDYFNRQDKPSISLCNPDYTELYLLNACYETQIKLKWNAQSEFVFTYPQYINGIELPAYNFIEGKRIIKIEGIGYFIINDVQDDFDGSVPIKTVTCLSQESDLVYKKITLFSGTFQFYNSTNPLDQNTLIGAILAMIPDWTIGTIDANIASMYRTFNVSDSNIYQFLTTDVSTGYNCVFVFDYFTKTMSAISADTSPNPTDIFLSFENLIKSTQYKEITTEVSTVLYCYGGGDLTIRDVNPLGTNAIYNFTYYKSTNWMIQSLIDALTAWEAKFTSDQVIYAGLLVDLSGYNDDLLAQQALLSDANATYYSDKGVRDARIQQGLDTTEIDAKIVIDLQNIANINVIISSDQDNINAINVQLISINEDLAFTNTNNFTYDQYTELRSFIFENTYKNDNIITTDSMTYSEVQAQALQLYDIGQTILAKTSIPRYQITIDSVNFLALQQYLPFINQMQLGNQITVDSGRGYLFYATLLEYDFSYENPDQFTLTLSNRQRIDDSHFVFSDLFGKNVKSSNDISFNQTNWNDWSVNKPLVIGNVIAPDGSLKYGIKAGSLVGVINANNNLEITNTNSITGGSNIRINKSGVTLQDVVIISGSNVGINGDITTAGGGSIHFRGGVYVGSTGLAPGTTIKTIENLTGTTGSYFTLSKTFLAGTLEVLINGIDQVPGITYVENSNVISFTIFDPVLAGDVVVAEYISLS